MNHMRLPQLFLVFGILIVTSCIKVKNPDLLHGEWVVVSIQMEGAEKKVKPQDSYIYEIKDTTIFYNTDNNSCGLVYRVPENGKIAFDEHYCTFVGGDSFFACTMQRNLDRVNSYHLRSPRLYFKADDEVLIVLEKKLF